MSQFKITKKLPSRKGCIALLTEPLTPRDEEIGLLSEINATRGVVCKP
jgi:hypothetical protein